MNKEKTDESLEPKATEVETRGQKASPLVVEVVANGVVARRLNARKVDALVQKRGGEGRNVTLLRAERRSALLLLKRKALLLAFETRRHGDG